MHRWNRVILGTVAGLCLCTKTTLAAMAEDMEYLPDSAPQVGTPVPMSSYDIKHLTREVTIEKDPLLLIDKSSRESGEAAVKFKVMRADGDQEIGIVFRYQDPKNFYVIVASAKDESCSLYRMKDGKRKKIDTKDAIVSPLTWHELWITFTKDKFTAIIDRELVLGAKDSGLKGPGLVGLWTKGDSRITFESFRLRNG